MVQKKSANRLAYDREVRRIQKAIERLGKEGYILPQDIIPKEPKRVTRKRIELLKTITPRVIRAESTKVNIETGEVEKKPLGVRIKPQKQKPVKAPLPSDVPIASEEIAPTPYNIFDRIQDMIEQIPSSIPCHDGQVWHEWNWQNDFPLMRVFMNAMQTIDNDELAEYYSANEERLAELLIPPVYPSDQDEIVMGFAQASFILNGGNALSANSSKMIGESSEV